MGVAYRVAATSANLFAVSVTMSILRYSLLCNQLVCGATSVADALHMAVLNQSSRPLSTDALDGFPISFMI
jgi:hypothetical protein